MFALRWLESLCNILISFCLIAFVVGIFSFGGSENSAMGKVGGIIEASFNTGFQFCEFTGYCQKDPTKIVNNLLYGVKDRYDKAVYKAKNEVKRQQFAK